jgi:hypothetical protein
MHCLPDIIKVLNYNPQSYWKCLTNYIYSDNLKIHLNSAHGISKLILAMAVLVLYIWNMIMTGHPLNIKICHMIAAVTLRFFDRGCISTAIASHN